MGYLRNPTVKALVFTLVYLFLAIVVTGVLVEGILEVRDVAALGLTFMTFLLSGIFGVAKKYFKLKMELEDKEKEDE